jgi:hypothetical protein
MGFKVDPGPEPLAPDLGIFGLTLLGPATPGPVSIPPSLTRLPDWLDTPLIPSPSPFLGSSDARLGTSPVGLYDNLLPSREGGVMTRGPTGLGEPSAAAVGLGEGEGEPVLVLLSRLGEGTATIAVTDDPDGGVDERVLDSKKFILAETDEDRGIGPGRGGDATPLGESGWLILRYCVQHRCWADALQSLSDHPLFIVSNQDPKEV